MYPYPARLMPHVHDASKHHAVTHHASVHLAHAARLMLSAGHTIRTFSPDYPHTMSLEPRLTLLRESGQLSADNEALLRRILTYFQEKRGIVLDEASGASFVTHLCACLQRISRGEALHEMDPEVYEDVQADPNFAKACEIGRDVQALCPVIPEAELKFLALHTCVILAKI